MSIIKIALIQSNIIWENPNGNRDAFEEKINSLNDVDLIVLPEMFNTGFTMNAESQSESMQGQTILWMKRLAKQHHAVLCGSIIIKENSHYYNRLLWVMPSGEYSYYDKKHLFTLAGEHKTYTAGTERKTVDYKGFRFCMNVCYDLRFPVWSRNNLDYDCLINIASWPETRRQHWKTLLSARAIENLSYVIAVNRVGEDHNGLTYKGDSGLIDPTGNWECYSEGKEEILYSSLNLKTLHDYRRKFTFLDDQDKFSIS